MEHKPLAELQTIADVKIAEPTAPMSREQRLQRWIEVLEANGNRKLRSLYQKSICRPKNGGNTAAIARLSSSPTKTRCFAQKG